MRVKLEAISRKRLEIVASDVVEIPDEWHLSRLLEDPTCVAVTIDRQSCAFRYTQASA